MKKVSLLTTAVIALSSASAFAEPTIEELSKKIDELTAKLEATADAIEDVGTSKSLEWASKTKIGGYGEHHYNIFDAKDDKVDAHRYVLFISHEYSDTVRFFSEFELEHSLAGEGKPGEVELEQAYIEWDFAENHSLVTGQFLVPVGILNETHEPDSFYGVERNLVEKNIVPSTWWETGLLVKGELAPGLNYDVAVHSGLNHEDAKIRSGRQKSAKAVANDLAFTARVKYTAINGLELAGTVQYQNDLTQGDVEGGSAILTELHGIYSKDIYSVRALWAQWFVDGDEFEATGMDKQYGYYIEPSIKPWEKLGFFARYGVWDNTGGLRSSTEAKTVDVGVNFWLHENVVFKADLQKANDKAGADSVNLGVGWSF